MITIMRMSINYMNRILKFFGFKDDDALVLTKEINDVIDRMSSDMVDDYFENKLPEIKFQKLFDSAVIPTYTDDYAEGMDLYSPTNVTVQAKGQSNILLGIAAEIPDGYWLKFESRSGTAWKNGIEVGAGVIDVNYNKELGVVLHNHSDKPYMIAKGDRIGQAILMRRNRAKIVEGTVNDSGRDGFGSSGK